MDASVADGETEGTGNTIRVEKRMVVEYGIALDGVWLPIAMLRRLGTHGPWSPPFTEATADQERVLLRHDLAERHNQVGLHRGVGLTGFLDAIPFEPTVPFEKVPGEGRSAPGKPGKLGKSENQPRP